MVLVASEDASMYDDGLSLLQTRAQKHEVAQEPVYTVGAGGTLCPDDEIITFAKCVEAQKRQLVPNTMAHGTVYNARGHSIQPIGCFKLGGNMYFNDEPATLKNDHRGIMPVCSPNGGRMAEIATQGISCQEPTCKQPAGHHKLIWDDTIFVPELKVGGAGTVCAEACEILTYEQCTKAGDMGLIEAITGLKTEHEPNHQTFGANHASGTMPSGCSARLAHGKAYTYFNSMDTPTGIRAAPNTDGQPWVTDSGVGSGWNQVSPICGVCTTTTVAPEVPEAEDDAAAAVGDPHMTRASGEKFDLVEGKLKHHHH